MEKNWRLIISEPETPSVNMAIDEAIFTGQKNSSPPTLRFYRWLKPSVSFGYFQNYYSVKQYLKIYPIVRRPTGGGIVLHGNDLTYSLSVKNDIVAEGDNVTLNSFQGLKKSTMVMNLFEKHIEESYRIIHSCLMNGLKLFGINAEFFDGCTSKGNFCFESPVRFDLIHNGKKIAGGAQKRVRNLLLHQGSVNIEKQNDFLISSIIKGFEKILNINFISGKLTGEEEKSVEMLVKKYESKEWNEKR